jgi:hypothetical protein
VQPFRIICETCRSRLKIRSADVIGQIHACPKCGSMVHIVPPAGWDANAAASTAEQSGAAGGSTLSLSPTASLIIPAGAMDDLSAVAAALEPQALEVSVEAAPSSVLPPAEAGSPVLLWAAGGIVAVCLVGGLAWAVWPSDKTIEPSPPVVAKRDPQVSADQAVDSKSATPPVEQSKAAAHDSDVVPSTAERTQAAQSANPKPAAEPVAADSALKAVKPTEPAASAPMPAATNTDPANIRDSAKVVVVEPAPTKVVPAPTPKAGASEQKAPDHSPVLKFDPLDFDVDRLGSNARSVADSTASTSSIPNKPPAEAAGNSIAANEVAAANAVAEKDKQPAAIDATPLHAITNGVMARRGPPGDVPQRVASQMLSIRVKALQVTDMPLVRFIDTMSGIAGAGITLDPIALEQVGISPQATVSVSAQDAPLQSILHDALAQRRLDIAEQSGQLRVVLPKADEPHAIDYDVKDVVARTDAAAVGQLIEHFVAPATWKSAGGNGTLQASGTTLHIEQSDAVRRQIVIFCERLRLARGLAVQSKYPATLLSVQSPYQRLSTKLSEHVTFTFLPWTRLDDVFRNWQELSGLTVLVDWGALAEAELAPSSPVACSANDRTWQESLDRVLEPLGLGWCAVDGETIQITTLAALETIQRIEFYQVPPKLRDSLASNQALIDSLQKELTQTAGKQTKAAPAHLDVDEPSGRLIVLATPTAHRHLSQRLAGAAKQ